MGVRGYKVLAQACSLTSNTAVGGRRQLQRHLFKKGQVAQGGQGGWGWGGGLNACTNGFAITVTLTNCSLMSNAAIGGAAVPRAAGSGGQGGNGYGGAILVWGEAGAVALATLTGDTMTSNSAQAGQGGAGSSTKKTNNNGRAGVAEGGSLWVNATYATVYLERFHVELRDGRQPRQCCWAVHPDPLSLPTAGGGGLGWANRNSGAGPGEPLRVVRPVYRRPHRGEARRTRQAKRGRADRAPPGCSYVSHPTTLRLSQENDDDLHEAMPTDSPVPRRGGALRRHGRHSRASGAVPDRRAGQWLLPRPSRPRCRRPAACVVHKMDVIGVAVARCRRREFPLPMPRRSPGGPGRRPGRGDAHRREASTPSAVVPAAGQQPLGTGRPDLTGFQWRSTDPRRRGPGAGLTGRGVRVMDMDGGIMTQHPDLVDNLNVGLSKSFVEDEGVEFVPGGGLRELQPCHSCRRDHRRGRQRLRDDRRRPGRGNRPGQGRADATETIRPSAAIAALVYAADIHADVVNMSWGVLLARSYGYPYPPVWSIRNGTAPRS